MNKRIIEKLKVLVWREWRLILKEYITAMSVCLMLTGFFWLIRLSMSVGNLAPVFSESSLLHEFSGLIYYMSATMSAAVFMSPVADLGIYTKDANANWMRYSFVLPYDAKIRAGAHYIVKVIKLVIAFVLSVVCGMATAVITQSKFTVDMIVFFVACVGVTMLYDTALECMVTKARTVKGIGTQQTKVTVTWMGAAMVYMFYKMMFDPNAENTDSLDVMIEKLRNAFLSHETIIIVLALIAIFGGGFIGWRVSAQNFRMHGDVREETEKGTLFTLKKKSVREGDEV